jgi:8-oxo-dGTP pyrophosphatase MutT (NUDIX family)
MSNVSCISLVRRTVKGEVCVLCVWNQRFHGYTLPGGKQDEGETDEQTQARELLEETGCRTKSAKFAFSTPHTVVYEGAPRTFQVRVFVVREANPPGVGEPGCPVAWLPIPVLLAISPFSDFYVEMFKRVW